VSAVKRVEFVSDTKLYIRSIYVVLRGRLCNSVLNVHATNEEKSDDSVFMRN
jgi:hypothetical protein